ncbi:MAG: peptidoglycan editing factor PgeF [Candidatus Falkowbacteria bacterium]
MFTNLSAKNNSALHLGLSTKSDGSMKNAPENRAAFFESQNLGEKIIIFADLAHTDKVIIVDDVAENKIIPNYDALITSDPKQILALTVADCLPIYFYDEAKKVIALAHAGWRGVASEIVKNVVSMMNEHYNSNPSDIVVFIGPHIHDCHFEIGEELVEKFSAKSIIHRDGQIFVDLAKEVSAQLVASGILPNKIEVSAECTYCLRDKYFSFRRDKPEQLETMVAYIGLINFIK